MPYVEPAVDNFTTDLRRVPFVESSMISLHVVKSTLLVFSSVFASTGFDRANVMSSRVVFMSCTSLFVCVVSTIRGACL